MSIQGMARGAGKIAKAATKPNTREDMMAKMFPRVLNKPATIVGIGAVAAFATVKTGLGMKNNAKLGKVTYADGPARMTQSYTTGAVQAMMQASHGNYTAFEGMAKNVVKGHGNVVGSLLDDYGADAKLVSALYNMHS